MTFEVGRIYFAIIGGWVSLKLLRVQIAADSQCWPLLCVRPLRKRTWRQWWSSERRSLQPSRSTLASRAQRSASRASSPSCFATASPHRPRRRTPSTERWPAPSSSAPNWMHGYRAGTCFWMYTTVTWRGRRSRRFVLLLRLLWGSNVVNCWGKK